MDRLITLEPSNMAVIRIEPAQKCSGELTLRNVMYTMPVAFRLQPVNKTRYSVRPQSGIIAPLATLTVEITYNLSPNAALPDSYPRCDDVFQLHSVVAPGAAFKDPSLDSVPMDWFTTRKKQVFIDSCIRVGFVGSVVLSRLVADGSMEGVREALEMSDPSWFPSDSVDSDGNTLLHLAISQSRPDLVQLILEFGSNPNSRSRAGLSPLEAAATFGEGLIAELLLAKKASTEPSGSSGWGPIHLAAAAGHTDVLRLLLVKGAVVDAVTNEYSTALHLAVSGRRRDCVRLLLANGARTDIRNSGDGDTALHIAAVSGDEHIVKMLLHKFANKDVRNRKGKTAYDVAAENGHNKLFDCLRLGDNLCTTARKGDVRAIHKLLENGASINGKDQNGWTALHRAAFKGRIEAARVLIEKGIELNARDEEGYTALHCATEAGQVELVELLIKKGADIDAATKAGTTALQIAESLHYKGISRLLLNGDAVNKGYSGKLKGDREINVGKMMIRRSKGNRRRSFDRSSAAALEVFQ
ncbi:protein VAPYRIN-like [Impatiens glandulifera]|uniref:protein VAPYRIN-like n=1 Tax=Impatiens glandulifera TaxID=253017 RepID=UPI001FB10A60|nr:protein VAPYRIN-like [Impatiens glandulifera]